MPLKPESRLHGISVGHQGRPVSNGLQMLGVDIAVVDLLSDRADSAHVVLVPMPPHATVYAPAVARSARSLRRAGWTDDQHSDRPLPATWILQARLFRGQLE